MVGGYKDTDTNEETICGVCMEVAGIESCGFGIGPAEIPANKEDQE